MRRLLWLAAVGALAQGCFDPGYPPRISAIVPAEGANDVDVAVTISGQALQPRILTDFDHPEHSGWNRTFSAALVPIDPSLPEVVLRDVRFESAGTLGATVGAGAARGFYGLRVVDAFGHQGFVPEIYRIVGSPSTVASFRLEPVGPQRPGVPFSLLLSAVDAEGRVVDGFTAGVDVKDDTGALSPVRVEPFVLGRARAQLTVSAFSPADTITATDGAGRKGSSNAFAVLPGLVVELAIVSASAQVAQGQCSAPVELEARDTFGFPARAEAALDVDLFAVPAQGIAFFADASCTQLLGRLTLPAGQSRASFYFRAAGPPGSFLLRVVPVLLPSASQTQTVSP